MCGIAGIVNYQGPPPTAADVHAMCEAIVHRGPDDEGLVVGDHMAMGMRRLSIIDVAAGHQPLANEDRSVWVVFNGEIYNYKELRADLEANGHRFATATDTETLVHLYEEHGAALLRRLRGMFAFAIWDARQHTLLLARDRLGIKPLYYAALPDGCVFASELKAILALPSIPRDVQWSAVGHVFTSLVTPATESIIRGVRKLDAAHFALCRPGLPIEPARYWDIRFEPDEQAQPDALVTALGETLDHAVSLHLRSDVPVGAFLSGGVDSSVVVAAMARQASAPVKTFSVGFEEPAYDERRFARAVAEAFGTEHHELVLTPQPVDVVERIVWHLDEPFGDSSAIPTYLLSKLAAAHVKVVLSGDGGDELFAGYDKYRVEERERWMDGWPRLLRRIGGAIGTVAPYGSPGKRWLTHVGLDGARRYLHASTLLPRTEQQRLLTGEARAALLASDPWAEAAAVLERYPAGSLSALQHCDLASYLPLDILVKVDRMTMAHSLEARPVLLDHHVVELATRIPERWQMQGGEAKAILKALGRSMLPDGIVDRPKQGFAVPLARWFRGAWTGFARDVLFSRACRERGIINLRYVEQLLRWHALGRNMDREIWTIACFEQWCRTFLDAPPATSTAPVTSLVAERCS